MGLVRATGGSIRMNGEDLLSLQPAQIARLGVGYVPQGRRLWRSLTVDEHLRMIAGRRRGAWTVERIYDTFPRLAERKSNGGGQLSGGEQQMLAIARALLTNPRLLIMDEPTEGLAPVIVAQVEDMLVRLGEEGDIAVLVIEQNIGVATAVSDTGRDHGQRPDQPHDRLRAAGRRPRPAAAPARRRPPWRSRADIDAETNERCRGAPGGRAGRRAMAPIRVYVSNPIAADALVAARADRAHRSRARTLSSGVLRLEDRCGHAATRRSRQAPDRRPCLSSARSTPRARNCASSATSWPAAACARGSSTSRPAASSPPATSRRRKSRSTIRAAAARCSDRDRGAAVTAMAEAFANWLRRQTDVVGIISAGGSGGASLVAPAMRALPIGVPKLIISSVASGDVAPYVGPCRHHHDVLGHRRAGPELDLAPGARQWRQRAGRDGEGAARRARGHEPMRATDLPAVGLTMFGVTTPGVQQIAAALRSDYECLVFHATGVGGQSMEKLVDSGLLAGVIDITTTEVCDLLMGGVFPATEDRFGAIIRTRIPYVGSVGALDMVNFGAPDTVPERYRGRKLHVHNPQVTLMRTTAEENERIGRWIGERLNAHGRAGALPAARRRRLRARRAGPAVPRPRGRRRAVPRARPAPCARPATGS